MVGYFFADLHGDVLAAYSDTTHQIACYTYDAWGNIKLQSTQSWGADNPIRYFGQYYDTESDMNYLRARYYSPDLCRFITEDPIKDGLNWYSYAGNNPVMRVDPTGENWITDKMSEVWNSTKWAFQQIGNYADTLQKAAQRNFWATGSQLILRDNWGDATSAWMLEHSLQDNPSDIWRGNDSRIAYLINNDSEYLYQLDNAIANAKNNKLDNKLISVKFKNGDLYYSIHKSNIYLTGHKRNDGKWIVNAILEDEYDFTEVQSFMDDSGGWSKQASKGTVANDLAFISQKTRAINPYHVTVNFWTTR